MTKSLGVLPPKVREYLADLSCQPRNPKQYPIPVYYRDEDGMYRVDGYELWDNKRFETDGRAGVLGTENLYRGGGLLMVQIGIGLAVIYDERSNWFRLVGGIARLNEGERLFETAIREGVVEELAVLSRDGTVRFVPPGTKSKIIDPAPVTWGISRCQEVVELGSLQDVCYRVNEENRAFEAVVLWDLSESDPAHFMVLHDEDWFKGGRSGIPVVLLDKSGCMNGFFSGQQGFVPIPFTCQAVPLHPTLKSVLNDLES